MEGEARHMAKKKKNQPTPPGQELVSSEAPLPQELFALFGELLENAATFYNGEWYLCVGNLPLPDEQVLVRLKKNSRFFPCWRDGTKHYLSNCVALEEEKARFRTTLF